MKRNIVLSLLTLLMLVTVVGAQSPLPETYNFSGNNVTLTIPFFSNISTTGITQNTATVTVTTNKPTTIAVEYGSTTNYGSTTQYSASGTSHSRTLYGLQSNKLYNFRVKTKDSSGVVVTSPNFIFTTSAPPPVTYQLTLNVTTGQGTLVGAGAYQANANVQLGATPAAGQQFKTWGGPTGCPQSTNANATIVMPASSLACTAEFETEVTPPPPTLSGGWNKLFDGSNPVNQNLWAYGYMSGAVDTNRNQLVLHWPTNGSPRVMLFSYNTPTAGFTINSDPSYNSTPNSPGDNTPGSGAHNCAAAYDSFNDMIWFSACAPQANNGAFAWNPVTKLFYKYANVPPPCGIDAAVGFDQTRKAMYCVGGYGNTNGAVGKLVVDPKPTSLASWSSIPTTNGPGLYTSAIPAPSTGLRLTYTRGGWDATADAMWVVDDNMDLWRWNPVDSKWTKRITSGTKPPLDTVFALDTTSRIIVGWAGKNFNTGTQISKTFTLDLVTYIWTEAATSSKPPSDTIAATAGQTINGRACFTISTGPFYIYCYVPSGVVVVPPPPPPTQQTQMLTVNKTGDGDILGSLPSGGQTVVGSLVKMSVVAATGSTKGAWTPSICADEFIMPNAALTCTITITKDTTPPPPPPDTTPPPPPTAGYPNVATIQNKTFIPVPCEPTIDLSPWPCNGGSKHQRWATDGKGNIWTGFGDTNPSKFAGNPSQGQGYKLNVATGQWNRWEPVCRPTGQIKPSFPDELSWAYDERGYFWLLGGVTQGSDGAICNFGDKDSGSILYKTGLFKYDVATDRWERFEGVNGTNALWGTFRNKTKELIYIGGTNENVGGWCGIALHKLNVDTKQVTKLNACLSTDPFPGKTPGRFENAADLRDHSVRALDEENDLLYIIGYHANVVNGDSEKLDEYKAYNEAIAANSLTVTFADGSTKTFATIDDIKFVRDRVPAKQYLHAWSIHLETGKITQLPDPPHTTPLNHRTPDQQDIVWDSKNKKIVVPYTRNACGVLEGMYTFNTVTKQWETHSIAPATAVPGGKVRGNTVIYDPVNNVVVIGGSVACLDWGFPGQPAITHYFFWRGDS